MSKPEDNEAFVKVVQHWLNARGESLLPDGWAGDQTISAWANVPAVIEWPSPDERSIMRFFGDPGTDLVTMDLPYPMLLSWEIGTEIGKIQCHRLVADSLYRILLRLLTDHGIEWIRHNGLHLFGGCYANRRQRGSKNALSLHAWGAAIDIDPTSNGMHARWPEAASMPIEAIEIFAEYGWKSGALAWGRDAMHFQATQ